MSVDPITLEVLRHRFEAIADEMESALLKSSHSMIVSDALDATAALFNVKGEAIAQAVGIPLHLGALVTAVRTIIEKFPPETMQEGDAYVLNDPYEGGTHLPDLIVAMPVKWGGRTVALSCTLTHHQDVGGMMPGSTPMAATDIFQEGLRIPPLKLLDRGRKNETFFALLTRNVRMPESTVGDLEGQIAACTVGVRRFLAAVEEFGLDTVLAAAEELLDRAERMMRERIKALPKGTYSFEDYLDNDGIDLDQEVRIRVSLTIDHDAVKVSFHGSSPQVKGPINAGASSTLSAVYFTVRAALAPDAPRNSGTYRCIEVDLPEKSVVNAGFPAAVNARSITCRRTCDALLGALAQAVPNIPACSNGHPLMLSFGGVDVETGRPFVGSDVGSGGSGARPAADGVDCVATETSNTMNTPVEILETYTPFQVLEYRLRPDSGGAGTYRGGLGFIKRYRLLRGEAIVSHRGERNRTRPWGLAGGGPGEAAFSVLRRADGTEERIPSKQDIRMRAGDELICFTTGGGGYGPPTARDPQAVLRDVLEGKVSPEKARELYGVVVDVEREQVDVQATERLRAVMKASCAAGGFPSPGSLQAASSEAESR